MTDEMQTEIVAPRRRRRATSPVDDAKAVAAAAKAAPTQPEGRVWITLEENGDISPRGQFFGINGAGYILRPGKKACVPKGIVDILDNAIKKVPVVNPDNLQIVDWVDQSRFPYRVHGPAA